MTTFESSHIHNAVSAGAIDAASADHLLEYLAKGDKQGNQLADEEQFRFLTSFNDIFVVIGIVLFLGAIIALVPHGFIADSTSLSRLNQLEPTAIAAVASWGLAEIFTRRRRMALPSIVLLLTFVGFSFIAALSVYDIAANNSPSDSSPFGLATASLVSVVAALLHWLRFKVPITVAAGAAAVAGLALSLVAYAAPTSLPDFPYFTILPAGVLILAAALWYDSTDRLRVTRRTDIAFWLHLLAAPLIVHPIVYPLTKGSGLTPTTATVIIGLFTILSLLALLIDRRALLVSSLTYFGYAAWQMIKLAGLENTGTALAVLIVGTTVLALSVSWQFLRGALVAIMPNSIKLQVPPIKNQRHKS